MYKTAIQTKVDHPELTDFLNFFAEVPVAFVDDGSHLSIQLDLHSRNHTSYELLHDINLPQAELARQILANMLAGLRNEIMRLEFNFIGILHTPEIPVTDHLLKFIKEKLEATK